MSTFTKGLLQGRWQPQLTVIRKKTKVNVTRPRLPHFERAKVEHLCVPYFTKQKKPTHIPNYDLCVQKEQAVELYPLEKILAKEAFNWINSSKCIGIFHLNHMNEEEKFHNQLVLKKNGFRFLMYEQIVLKAALEGTKFEPVLPLFVTDSVIAVCPEPEISKLANLLNKLQKLVCMAAVVEDKFLNVTDIQYFGKYKSIDEARAQLLGTLQASAQNLVQKITHHPANLVQLLNQYQQEKNK